MEWNAYLREPTHHIPRQIEPSTPWIEVCSSSRMRQGKPRADDINERALAFVCRVLDFVPSIKPRPGTRRVADQLVGAAGGIGSNLEEAVAASSRREFVRFNEIALRETRESVFWLKVCKRSRLGDQTTHDDLLDEGQQIARIIAAIIINTKRNGL